MSHHTPGVWAVLNMPMKLLNYVIKGAILFGSLPGKPGARGTSSYTLMNFQNLKICRFEIVALDWDKYSLTILSVCWVMRCPLRVSEGYKPSLGKFLIKKKPFLSENYDEA